LPAELSAIVEMVERSGGDRRLEDQAQGDLKGSLIYQALSFQSSERGALLLERLSSWRASESTMRSAGRRSVTSDRIGCPLSAEATLVRGARARPRMGFY
jgi:hypothetical protein